MQPHPDRNGPTMSALGYDPVPGDVDAVRRVATMLGAVADQADTITTRLRGIDDGTGPQVWRGPAADAFHRLLDDIGPDVIRLASAHREAEDALRSYAGDLDGAQFMGRRAESDAGLAISDRERAEADRARAAEEAAAYQRQVGECRLRLAQAGAARLTALTDPVYQAELTRYEGQVRGVQQQAESRAAEARGRENAARSAGSAAEARVQAARLLAEQAKQVRDDSARRVVNRLDAAAPTTNAPQNIFAAIFHEGGALDRITAGPGFARFMQHLSDAGGYLINIGSVVALVPGLHGAGLVLMGVGLGLKAVSFAGTLLARAYGHASNRDVLYRGLDLGLSVVTARMGAGGAGAVKRALFYGDARRATGAWRSISAARRLAGPEGTVVARHLSPQLYFRGATYAGTGLGVVNAGIGSHNNVRQLLDPTPQRPRIIELAPAAAGAGIGAGAARVGLPVLGGATGGAVELGSTVVQSGGER